MTVLIPTGLTNSTERCLHFIGSLMGNSLVKIWLLIKKQGDAGKENENGPQYTLEGLVGRFNSPNLTIVPIFFSGKNISLLEEIMDIGQIDLILYGKTAKGLPITDPTHTIAAHLRSIATLPILIIDLHSKRNSVREIGIVFNNFSKENAGKMHWIKDISVLVNAKLRVFSVVNIHHKSNENVLNKLHSIIDHYKLNATSIGTIINDDFVEGMVFLSKKHNIDMMIVEGSNNGDIQHLFKMEAALDDLQASTLCYY
jgi:hypothetical protein